MNTRPVNGHLEPAARRPVGAAVGAGARVLPPPLVPALPSARNLAKQLGGHVREDGCVAFPGPGRKRKDRSCTLKLDERAPDGFIVADARQEIDDLKLKDYVREQLGLEPFQSRRPNGEDHRQANGAIVHNRAKDRSEREGGGGPKGRLSLLPFHQIKVGTRRRDLVAGLIPRTGLTVIWGAPKSGKSFFTFDVMMHVALGWPYRERRVHAGAIVYCALEGQSGIEARVEAWRQANMSEAMHDYVPFFLQPVTFNLAREHKDLVAEIRRQLGSTAPVAIVLDTLARSMDGSESDDEAMGAYIRAADTVREALGCAVICVHHCGHGGNRPRGHSSLIGAADAVIAVRKSESGQIVASVDMSKDGSDGATLASRLDVIVIGHDEDGAEITSCAIRPVEPAAETSQAKQSKPARLRPASQIALNALKEALAAEGTVPAASNHIPATTPTVSLNLWRKYVYQRNPDGTAEARKKAFQRSREELQARGLVGVWATESCTDEEAQCWLIR